MNYTFEPQIFVFFNVIVLMKVYNVYEIISKVFREEKEESNQLVLGKFLSLVHGRLPSSKRIGEYMLDTKLSILGYHMITIVILKIMQISEKHQQIKV